MLSYGVIPCTLLGLFGMGGHQTKQSVEVSTNIVSNVIQNTTLNCFTSTVGNETIAINGDYNIVDGVRQDITINVKSDCLADVTNKNKFNDKLSTSISQLLKDSEVALTQWADTSKDDTNAKVTNTITQTVTDTTVVTCVNSVKDQSVLSVTGNNNVVRNIVQNTVTNYIAECLLKQNNNVTMTNDISDIVNQHSTYDSENPFAFITDAIEAVMKSAMVFLAVIFIIIVCLVAIFMALHQKKKAPTTLYGNTS